MYEAPEFSMHDLHEFLQAFIEFLHVWHWCAYMMWVSPVWSEFLHVWSRQARVTVTLSGREWIRCALYTSGRGRSSPQSAAYSSHSAGELQPCLWRSLLKKVKVEKYSLDKIAPHKYSSDRAASTTPPPAGAMLWVMLWAGEERCSLGNVVAWN